MNCHFLFTLGYEEIIVVDVGDGFFKCMRANSEKGVRFLPGANNREYTGG